MHYWGGILIPKSIYVKVGEKVVKRSKVNTVGWTNVSPTYLFQLPPPPPRINTRNTD